MRKIPNYEITEVIHIGIENPEIKKYNKVYEDLCDEKLKKSISKIIKTKNKKKR